eukprot:314243-Chlamydomonas_euryale.AAC.2
MAYKPTYKSTYKPADLQTNRNAPALHGRGKTQRCSGAGSGAAAPQAPPSNTPRPCGPCAPAAAPEAVLVLLALACESALAVPTAAVAHVTAAALAAAA